LLQPIATLATAWAGLNLAFLPSSDPGGGRPWLNGVVVQVGGALTDLGLEDGTGMWALEDGTGVWEYQ
jgi:hypothetical protein